MCGSGRSMRGRGCRGGRRLLRYRSRTRRRNGHGRGVVRRRLWGERVRCTCRRWPELALPRRRSQQRRQVQGVSGPSIGGWDLLSHGDSNGRSNERRHDGRVQKRGAHQSYCRRSRILHCLHRDVRETQVRRRSSCSTSACTTRGRCAPWLGLPPQRGRAVRTHPAGTHPRPRTPRQQPRDPPGEQDRRQDAPTAARDQASQRA